jgi:hypothetical protein
MYSQLVSLYRIKKSHCKNNGWYAWKVIMDSLDKVQYLQQIHDIGSVFFIALGCNFIFLLIICLGISCCFSVNEKK